MNGESDCHAAWTNGIQCIGVPGAKNFSPKYAPYFEKFDKIYIHSEKDAGAKTFISGISEVLPTNKLYIVNSKAIDSNCKDLADLHIHGKLNLQALLNTAVKFTPATTEEQQAVQKHVLIGQQLIELLQLKCYNNELYYYFSTDGVYKLADDKILKNAILRHIDINAKKNLCNETLEFVRNYLSDNGTIQIDENYVNFKNGIYDIKNKCLLKHKSDIFTINQVHINFLVQIPENIVVDDYLNELTNYVETRKKALLQMIGYTLVPTTCIQQSQIWYGPTASNGKSTFAKILMKIVGPENVSHVELQQFEKRFGTHEISQKLLNIVPELPATRIKDLSTFKGFVTGDEMSVDIKYKSRQTIVPYAKHVFTTNCLPQVNDPTNGFYRRLNIVMFDNKFEVNNNFDINVFFRQENLDYLGNIGFQSFLKMLESGKLEFANNVESLELLENYKRINNTILGFLKDEESAELFGKDIKTTEMWRRYKAFCGDNRLEPLPKLQFYEQLVTQFGFVKKLNTGIYYFYRQAPLDDSEFSEIDIKKF